MKRFFPAVLLSFLSLALGAAPAVRTVWEGGRSYSNISDVARNYRLQLVRGNDRIELSGGGNRVVLYPAKRQMYFNNVLIMQSFAPLQRGSVPYQSTVDFTGTLEYLLAPGEGYERPIRTIMLDIGHGGKDHGAIGKTTNEKSINLRLGRRLAAILAAYGYRVVLTRNSDVFLELGERCRVQKQAKADLFISLHVNSTTDASVRGIETFCLALPGTASSNGGAIGVEKNAGNQFNPNNLLLAYHVQRSLLVRTGAIDRGVKRARFVVLRDIECPGVWVEVGFLSNRQEEANLTNAAYIEKLARGIAEGVVNYRQSLRQPREQ